MNEKEKRVFFIKNKNWRQIARAVEAEMKHGDREGLPGALDFYTKKTLEGPVPIESEQNILLDRAIQDYIYARVLETLADPVARVRLQKSAPSKQDAMERIQRLTEDLLPLLPEDCRPLLASTVQTIEDKLKPYIDIKAQLGAGSSLG